MPNYSLKQLLIENEEPVRSNLSRMGAVSRLVNGIKKTKSLDEAIESPITPRGTGWDHLTDPDRLRRIFTIENQCSRRLFINDVLNLADQSMHGIIVRIRGEEIEVEIYTEDLNDITNMDFEYAKDVEEIYVDAMFSFNNQNLGDTRELW